MAFSITCPACLAQFRTVKAIPLGRQVQCPKCKETFAVSTQNMIELESRQSGSEAVSERDPVPTEKAVPVDKSSNKTSRRDEGEEDVERPQKNRRDDDEDERAPRDGKRRTDGRDDRPSRARDRDDEDRPSKRKVRSKKEKGDRKTVIAAGGVVAAACIAFLLVRLSSPNYDSEMLSFMPVETTNLSYMIVEKFYDHPKLKEHTEGTLEYHQNGAILKRNGLSLSDVKSMLFGKKGSDALVTVVRLKKSFDRSKMTSGATELREGNKSYWKLKTGHFVTFPSVIVVTEPKIEVMKTILTKEVGKIVVSEKTKSLIGRVASGDYWHVDELGIECKGHASRVDIGSQSLSGWTYDIYSSSDIAKKRGDFDKNEMIGTIAFLEAGQARAKAGGNTAERDRMVADVSAYKNATIRVSGEVVENFRTLDLTPFTNYDGSALTWD